MILPSDIKPEKCLYAIGSSVVDVLKRDSFGIINSELLYVKFSDIYPESVSYSYFLYALDWLYLLGLVEVTEKLEIKRCF